MYEELVNAVLGRNKTLLQEQLHLFCRQYKRYLDIGGDMDSAREMVSEIGRQLVSELERPTEKVLPSAMLVTIVRAELQVTNVREQLNALNTDAMRIVEIIKFKVQEFIATLAQQYEHEQEDRQKLLAAFHATPKLNAASPQTVLQMVDLLTTEELRYLSKFVTSDVADPAHQKVLEDLTRQITVRVCQSFMMESMVPDEAITDPAVCFERHLKNWQDTLNQLHEKHKIVSDKIQLQRGIDSGRAILGKLDELKKMSMSMCESLQAEIKAPGAFHALGKVMSFIYHLGNKTDAAKIKNRELELWQDATRRIDELIEIVDRTLKEAMVEQENPVNLERIMHKLDEIDSLHGNAKEIIRKVKEDLKAYENTIIERKEARGNSFYCRWSGTLAVAALGALAPSVEAAVKKRLGF